MLGAGTRFLRVARTFGDIRNRGDVVHRSREPSLPDTTITSAALETGAGY